MTNDHNSAFKPPSHSRSRWITLALGVFGIGLFTWFRLATDVLLEDALITYRFAENMADGQGFSFNPGERVLGTSTPLYTLLLAAFLTLPAIDVITLSSVLGILFTAAAGCFVFAALTRLEYPSWAAAGAALVFYLHRTTLWTATGGMETPLVYLLMSLTVFVLASRRSVVAAGICAILVVVRVDGLIWSSMVLAFILWRDRRNFAPSLLTFAAIAAPWFVFSIVEFGHWLPQSAIAKSSIGSANSNQLSELARYYASAFAPARFLDPVWLLWVLSCLAGIWWAPSKRARALMALIVAFVLSYTAAFTVAQTAPFPWYRAPIVWASSIAGVAGICGSLSALRRVRAWSPRRIPAVIGIALALFLGAKLSRGVYKEYEHQRKWRQNERTVRQALGEWLLTETPPGALLATESIGYQAYFSGRPVLDFAGLVSPEIVDLYRQYQSNAEVFYQAVRARKPDYIVLRAFEVEQNRHFHGGPLFASAEQEVAFRRRYIEKFRLEAPHPEMWGRMAVVSLFERRQANHSTN